MHLLGNLIDGHMDSPCCLSKTDELVEYNIFD